VTLNTFKGSTLVDIREYYETKGGELKPGQKGISLTTEQWQILKSNFASLAAALAAEAVV
jgi:Transcriptional Coactivator p15 (PC4)